MLTVHKCFSFYANIQMQRTCLLYNRGSEDYLNKPGLVTELGKARSLEKKKQTKKKKI